MERLRERVCVVTGAGSRSAGIGTGRATALRFAAEGGRVLLIDRDVEAAEVTAAMIAAEGGEAMVAQADATVASQVEHAVGLAVQRWGRLDVLHNNLGIHGPGTVLETDVDAWSQVLATNVTSVVIASRAVIPHMQGSGGVIINMSSIAASRPRGATAYSTSKGAIDALTRAMAVDHGPQGIRVNAIAPGPIHTPMVAASGMTAAVRERRREASVLGIEGTAWDVAHAAVYLASDEARYVTGVVLRVDGGATLRGPDR